MKEEYKNIYRAAILRRAEHLKIIDGIIFYGGSGPYGLYITSKLNELIYGKRFKHGHIMIEE